jgi:signal transduction histidine kinase
LRVVLHGVLLLGVSAVGFLFITLVLLGSEMDRDLRTFTEWFGAQACERAAHASDPVQEISRFPAAVAVFNADGTRLAASLDHPIAPLSVEEQESARRGLPAFAAHGRRMVMACPGETGRYAVVGGPPMGLPLGRLSLLVAIMVALVAVGSIPLARSLIRPLRELVSAADTFGSGDLTARAKVARTDEIGDLARAFNAMAENLQAHLMAERELLANVSHELRTPLARVRVVLETAKEDPGRAATLLHEVSHDLNDLERLTDDVLATIRLDFSGSAPESAKIRIRPESVDVVAILQRAIARCVESNPERDIELEAGEDVPTVQGDPVLLLRLFDNLIENARKYSSKTISVAAQRTTEGVSIVVRDAGIGIETADLERVFEPFFRSDRSRGRATGGTGLGLTLCRRIVEVHRGTIAAESELGVGTTVTVQLPCATHPVAEK